MTGTATRAEEIEKFLGVETETELYEMLADSAGLGADEIDKEAEGRSLFSRLWIRHREKVCSNDLVRAYVRDPTTSDATMVAMQVANVFIAIQGVNIAIVAALILRIGLRTLCRGRDA